MDKGAMANSIFMVPVPGGVWSVDVAEFAAAARDRWPGALIGGPHMTDARTEVWIQTNEPAGPGLDCTFAPDAVGDGSFSIRSGESVDAADMFAWVREWLGPDNRCVVLETGTADRGAEVPFGLSSAGVREVILSVAPR